ncbi:MAG: hypothetical protein KDJ86_03495 [Bauldia sp.]|uniref:hypothetical protein n=1 Tax=Bauldia sp. TaxID=2575872 RepID=UPI001D62CD35|nr:hypothetical protein [Bauldia sp.]MCB1494827.1 hypothetical protein [Bauldia sp.]
MVDTPTVWKPQHLVNTETDGWQEDPIAIDIGLGRYIVVWEEGAGGPIGTGPGDDLVGQIFDARGNPVGDAFQVNQSYTADDETDASLAMRPGGGFVMVYEDNDGLGTSIRVDTYDADGNRIVTGVPETIADNPILATISNPEVAMRPDGSYLVAYQSKNLLGDTDIVGRIVSSSGTVGAQFTIFNEPDDASNPDVAVLTNGNFVVVYEDEFMGADLDVKFTIVSPTGSIVTSGVVESAPEEEDEVQVAALAGGGFVAVWTDGFDDGSSDGIRARIYDNNGNPAVGGAFTVNTTTAGSQNEPGVVALEDGGFVVVWDDDNTDEVRGQRYDADGNKVGVEFLAGTGDPTDPTAALLGDGRFIIPFEEQEGADDSMATIFDPRTGPIIGTGEDDVLTSRVDGAKVKGKDGNDILLGDDGKDVLIGNGGKDILSGGLHKDKMKGGGGKDWFVFDSALGGKNKETIKDFKENKDKLFLEEDVFASVGNKVNKKELAFGDQADDGNDYLIYNQGKGKLWYDEDAKGGSAKVLVAKLKHNPDLDHKDFMVGDFTI